METLADFGTVSYFAVEVFTLGIFKAWFGMGDLVAACQLATCLLGFVAVVVALEQWNRGEARYHAATPRRPEAALRLRGAGAIAAFAACAAPVVFGFVLPVGILLQLALTDPAARLDPRVFALVGNSFTVAGVTALVAVATATLMVYAARLSRRQLVANANRLAALGYAIPGAVIAVGILVPLGKVDNALAAWLEAAFGIKVGLLLTGWIDALVYTSVVRFFVVGLHRK